MKRTFKTEIREAEGVRWLEGTILQEGRAASGGRAEVFAPGSVSWPSTGVGIRVGHGGEIEAQAIPSRDRGGHISIRARATEAIQAAVADGARFMSVEFVAVRDRVTRGGVREVLAAIVPAAALVRDPEYDSTRAEVRARRRRRVFL